MEQLLEQGTERPRGGEGYIEVRIIWQGVWRDKFEDETLLFDPDGQPLDPKRLTFGQEVWQIQYAAFLCDADVDIYVVEHDHAPKLAADAGCDCDPANPPTYWSHRQTWGDVDPERCCEDKGEGATRTEQARDESRHIMATVIWEGELDEERVFDVDGESLDPEDPRTFEAWLDDVKRDALDADADVQVYAYVVEPGVPEEDEEWECTCAQDITDGEPYWSSRGSRETDDEQ